MYRAISSRADSSAGSHMQTLREGMVLQTLLVARGGKTRARRSPGIGVVSSATSPPLTPLLVFPDTPVHRLEDPPFFGSSALGRG